MITKGQRINDRYEIVKSIGEGGMANVYLAYDVILERDVAVKVLRGDLAKDEKFVRRFQREALSASSLSHPNIVEVYDVGEDNGIYYIVMEFIKGRHLKDLVKKRGKLTVREVVDIMLQITDGMADAHDSYIIHRDIKPQNIMILENGIIKITDFGIAVALNGTQLTQTNSVMGSVHYLPPEQAAGRGSTIQSDVYSMGILMYELLTGVLPYKGDNAVEIALKHLKEHLPPARLYVKDIPQAVENIILKSAAKNPKNRYKDAREMHNDLKTVLSETRENEDKFKYEHAEGDSMIKKEYKKGKETNKKIKEENTIKNIKKKENKTLLVLGIIFTAIILITVSMVLLLPRLLDAKDVIVPDVSKMSVSEAEKLLVKNKLVPDAEIREVTHDKIKEGKIVKTDPAIGRIVKEKSKVILYKSSGKGIYEMEDFTGQNYIEVKTILEKIHNLFVIIEEVDISTLESYEEGNIIKHEPEAKEEVVAGDIVTLYIPDMSSKYPDFTKGDVSLKEIEDFAAKYKLDLEIEYFPTSKDQPGKIIRQSPSKDTIIVPNTTFKIVIAELEEEEID